MSDLSKQLALVAVQAAKTLGYMRMPSEAISLEVEPCCFSLELIHLRTGAPRFVVAHASKVDICKEDLRKALEALLRNAERGAEHLIFKLETLESGRRQWVHWDLRGMRRQSLCGREIVSDPIE